MPKSKNNKNHRERLNRYKANKKKEQDTLKKKMIEQYMKMQQQTVSDKEAHTSTEEVSGPEINIEELNEIENLETIDENLSSDLEIEKFENTIIYDNDNK